MKQFCIFWLSIIAMSSLYNCAMEKDRQKETKLPAIDHCFLQRDTSRKSPFVVRGMAFQQPSSVVRCPTYLKRSPAMNCISGSTIYDEKQLQCYSVEALLNAAAHKLQAVRQTVAALEKRCYDEGKQIPGQTMNQLHDHVRSIEKAKEPVDEIVRDISDRHLSLEFAMLNRGTYGYFFARRPGKYCLRANGNTK